MAYVLIIINLYIFYTNFAYFFISITKILILIKDSNLNYILNYTNKYFYII